MQHAKRLLCGPMSALKAIGQCRAIIHILQANWREADNKTLHRSVEELSYGAQKISPIEMSSGQQSRSGKTKDVSRSPP